MKKLSAVIGFLLMLGVVALSTNAQDSQFTVKPFAKQENMALGLTFSPDGGMIIVGGGLKFTANGMEPFSDNGITIWDAATGEKLRHLPSTATFIADVVLTPDGKQVIGAFDDASVGIWDVETGELLRQVQNVNTTKLAISPDGQMVISSQRASHPILWDFQTGKIIHTFAESTVFYAPVGFSPNGKTIAIIVASSDAENSPSSLIMWDTETKNELCRADALSMAIPGSAFSPDGRYLALATFDKGILVVDGETCEIVHQFENTNAQDTQLVDAADAVSFSADGKQILSSWEPGDILLWDVETGASTYVGSDDSRVYHVSFTPDGIPISTSYSGAINMWIPNG